jgi:hypothetical protein
MDQITVEVQVGKDCDTLKKTGTVAEIAAWIGGFGFTAAMATKYAEHLSSSADAMVERSSPVVLRGSSEVSYAFFRRPYEPPTRHTMGIL